MLKYTFSTIIFKAVHQINIKITAGDMLIIYLQRNVFIVYTRAHWHSTFC